MENTPDDHIHPVWEGFTETQQFPIFTQLTSSDGPAGSTKETLKFFICQEFERTNPQITFCIKGPWYYTLRS